MHEGSSIIINSFLLFQQTKGFRVTHSGGGWAPPYSTNFFWKKTPIKTDAPHEAPPQLNNDPPPQSEKQSPHWNMKYPSMNWFLEKAQ